MEGIFARINHGNTKYLRHPQTACFPEQTSVAGTLELRIVFVFFFTIGGAICPDPV